MTQKSIKFAEAIASSTALTSYPIVTKIIIDPRRKHLTKHHKKSLAACGKACVGLVPKLA
jgi:hypothetical protein